jgi:flagellar biosynthesis protein FlhF
MPGEEKMTVKRFVAPDMRRALDLVRQEMGPDAIILSSQRTREGVEIITSSDLDVVARGGAERKSFGQRFDQDFDQPLASDAAWQAQAGAAEAAQKYAPQPTPQTSAPETRRREQLAREIESARERMLTAKLAEQNRARQAAAPAPVEMDTVRWQERPAEPRRAPAPAAPVEIKTPVSAVAPVAVSAAAEASATQAGNVDRQMAGLQEQIKRLSEEQTRKHEQQENRRLATLQNEIADMRMLLEQQMLRMREQGGMALPSAGFMSPVQDALQSHLAGLGLPASLVKKLALAAKPGKRLNAAWRDALALLTRQLGSDQSDRVQRGGIFAFVGATGVGKTTTIAKLAARYVLEHGLGKVALITTDTYRVGAHDQLRSLGRILNVPVRVVDQERSLPIVIASLKNYPLILIDTAGFRQGDPLLKEQEALLDACPGVERILVLASNSQMQTLKASAHAYAGGKIKGCILTKLDECGSLGEALGVLIQQHLPVLYCTSGQAIPSDITVGSAASLVAKAVAIVKSQHKEKVAAVGLSAR